MRYNNEIQPTRVNVTECVTKMRNGEYFVDNSFQRRLVWNEKQKVRLIETIFMDYPMPEIYLWDQKPDPHSGLQRLSIVDGQQRLSTLREFTSNEWPLRRNYLDEENQGAEYANCFWKDLSPELRSAFFQYSINARRIPSDVTEDDIRTMFARLNETDRSLNPQELRNATLNGEFLIASKELADSDEFQSLGIFKVDHLRRMGDVEFASQLLGYERKGIVSDTPVSMNELYNEFNDSYPEATLDQTKIRRSLKKCQALFEDGEIRSFFATQNYVYTLHSLFDVCEERPNEQWADGFRAFIGAYEGLPADDREVAKEHAELAEFRKGASSRTRSKSSRAQRLFGLKNWLAAHCDGLIEDRKRSS